MLVRGDFPAEASIPAVPSCHASRSSGGRDTAEAGTPTAVTADFLNMAMKARNRVLGVDVRGNILLLF